MQQIKNHIAIALGYFLIVALLGVLLRLFYVFPLPFNFKYIVHTHSHIALLGFVYIGITTLIYKIYLQENDSKNHYRNIFVATNICLIGMLLSFPLQGYGLFSITFSTLFLLITYAFSWFALKNIGTNKKHLFSWKLMKSALFYLILSSIGPWAIGVVMATLGTESIWYKNAIYFYLHFQYNGWFLMSLLSFIFYILEQRNAQFHLADQRKIYCYLQVSVVLTLFLSVLWSAPHVVFNYLGGIGAIIQIVVFFMLYQALRKPILLWKQTLSVQNKMLLTISLALLIIKIFLQLLSANPEVAQLVVQFRDFVIGYLHLVLLGIIVNLMLLLLNYFNLLQFPRYFLKIFLIAFFTTEILIFYKALSFWLRWPFIPHYYTILALFSCLFPIAAALILWRSLKGNFSRF